MPRWVRHAVVGVLLVAAGAWIALRILGRPAPEPPAPPAPSFALRKASEVRPADGLRLIEGEFHRDAFHLFVADLTGRPGLQVRTVTHIGEGASVRKVALETGALVALNGTFYDFTRTAPGEVRGFLPCSVVWDAGLGDGPARVRGRFYHKPRWYWSMRRQGDGVRFRTGPEVARAPRRFGPPAAAMRERPIAGLGGVCGLIRDGRPVALTRCLHALDRQARLWYNHCGVGRPRFLRRAGARSCQPCALRAHLSPV